MDSGFKALKFGWGTFGKNGLKNDIAHLIAAREGVGDSTYLMVDAGTIWNENVKLAQKRMQTLKDLQRFLAGRTIY